MKLETLPPALQTITMALFTLPFVAFVFALLGIASTIFKSKIGLISNDEKDFPRAKSSGRQTGSSTKFIAPA